MGFFNAVFGGTPSVPAWNNINLGQQQQLAIGQNQSALPGAEKLAGGVDAFNQQQLTSILNSIIPGWDSMAKTATGNIASELKGEIPTDVSQTLQSSDAAKSLTGGFGGSGLAGNLTARDLGLTSLNLTQTGTSSLESWTSMVDKMFSPGMFNISSMFVTPQQEFESSFQNQQQQWQTQWLKNQVAAMPDPVLGGINSEIMSVISAYLGGGGNFSTKGGSGSPGSTPGGGNFNMGGDVGNMSSGAGIDQSWNQGEAGSMLGTAFF